MRQQYYKQNIYELHENQIVKMFVKKNTDNIKKIIDNKITKDNLNDDDIEKMDLYILKTAFQLIPLKTNKIEHKHLAKTIISTFAKKLLSKNSENRVDYKVSHDFLDKLAYVSLTSSKEDIAYYLEAFIEGFNSSEPIAEMFKIFISVEDKLATDNNFWYVWNLFYDKIVEICKDKDRYWHIDKIIKSYLFAQTLWKNDVTEWHTLREVNKMFFKKIAENIGYCPSVLYSITKLLNNIGSIYLNDGVVWISNMLNNNKNLWTDKLEEDTIYYLEKVVKKYIFMNCEKIKKTKQLKEEIMCILNFLIEKGSITGYLLREQTL